MNFFFDPTIPGKLDKIKKLPPTRGFCVVADIVDSVKQKDKPTAEWACLFSNTLRMVRSILCGGGIQKVIGDAVMGFITEKEFYKVGMNSMLHQFCGLVDLAREFNPPHGLPVKLSIVYCVDAYELSFIEDVPDVYGKDIDLTFRLVSKAKEREVLMNKGLYDCLSRECDDMSNTQPAHILYSQIQGPEKMKIRGFREPVSVYKLPVNPSLPTTQQV